MSMLKNYFLAGALLLTTSLVFSQDKKASVNFDGVDDYIKIADDPALNLGTGAFTIEAWITIPPTATVNNPMILSKKGFTGPAREGFLFGLTDGGKVAMEMEGVYFRPGWGGNNGPSNTVKAADLRDGICHHIAWVREKGGAADTVQAYQDGLLVRKTRQSAKNLDGNPCNLSVAENLWIGWSEDDTVTADKYQWFGEIKEVRIWNVTRTQDEIKDNANVHLTGNEPGLVAYWRLNENWGQTVYDCSGNGNNGVMKNGPTWKNFICDNMQGATPSCANGQPLGVEDSIAEQNIKLFPNPAVNKITIQSENDVLIDKIVIYDINGRVSFEDKYQLNRSIDVSSLKAGTYSVQLVSGQNVVYRSLFMKE